MFTLILGTIYWIANIFVMACAGNIISDIDSLEDVKVWHIILAVAFLPATILLYLVGCIGVGCIEFSNWWKKKKLLKFLYKPVFKKKEQKDEKEGL